LIHVRPADYHAEPQFSKSREKFLDLPSDRESRKSADHEQEAEKEGKG